MRIFTRTLLSCFLFLGASARAAAEEKIITITAGSSPAAAIKAIEGMGGTYLRSLKLINAIVADLPPAMKGGGIYTAPDIAGIEDDPYIQWVIEPAGPFMPPASEERKGSPASKEIPWGVAAVNAPEVWPVTEGAGVKVAVFDSGIDSRHPDLAENYAGGFNAADPSKPPTDEFGHGTMVAGIIAAARDLKGVVGVAPKARVYAVKVLDKRNAGKLSWIVAGLQWAVENKIDIVNMSLGSPVGAPAFERAVKAAMESGLTLVCAAGNKPGPVNYPARYEGVIAVTASDRRGDLMEEDSTGPEVDLIAPGVDIRTTSKGGHYDYAVTGTSFATPHVSGVAALAVGLGLKRPEEIKKALTGSARDLHLSASEQGSGLVDAGKLLKLQKPPPVSR